VPDFFPEAIASHNTEDQVSSVFQLIYRVSPPLNTYIDVNLQWPKHDVPLSYDRYLFSWHTEYMDVDWLVRQCQRVHPRPVLCITDWPCDAASLGMSNLECVTYTTVDQQIDILIAKFGVPNQIQPPRFKLSSLSSRVTQYKKFITAYLLQNFKHEHMMLSWHAKVRKPEDNHGHPAGWTALDSLDFRMLEQAQFINREWDGFAPGFQPIDNGNWDVPGINLCAVNCTNETWHYNRTIWNSREFEYPGPYLTEKTLKPLIAGRAILSIGQSHSHAWLQHLGFNNNFGYDLTFDQDAGDLSRITKIFKVIDVLNEQSLEDIYLGSKEACAYNLEWIKSGALGKRCDRINQPTIEKISQWAAK
jgi:hypothetical protein